jgi:hypothetical protein
MQLLTGEDALALVGVAAAVGVLVVYVDLAELVMATQRNFVLPSSIHQGT